MDPNGMSLPSVDQLHISMMDTRYADKWKDWMAEHLLPILEDYERQHNVQLRSTIPYREYDELVGEINKKIQKLTTIRFVKIMQVWKTLSWEDQIEMLLASKLIINKTVLDALYLMLDESQQTVMALLR